MNDQLPLTGQWVIGTFHEHTKNETERVKELITAHYLKLPEDSCPISTNEQDMNEFASFFISYLFCSFEYLLTEPRLVQLSGSNSDSNCWCELCTRLTDAPNLKLKKITNWDKGIADSLEEEAVRQLLLTLHISVSEEKINKLLEESTLAESRALIAYGIELIRRCNGEESDSSSLVLWRRFAWENGSPKKDFVLEIERITEAENKLISRLRILSDDNED
jgi:hypothetical protein